MGFLHSSAQRGTECSRSHRACGHRRKDLTRGAPVVRSSVIVVLAKLHPPEFSKEVSMSANSKMLIDLEKKFWQSMVDQETDVALDLLHEPSLMVSTHGMMKFDHADYRKMAEHGSMIVKSFELSDVDVVFPTSTTALITYQVKQVVAPRDKGEVQTQEMADSSTWVQTGKRWQCVMHTETPVAKASAH